MHLIELLVLTCASGGSILHGHGHGRPSHGASHGSRPMERRDSVELAKISDRTRLRSPVAPRVVTEADWSAGAGTDGSEGDAGSEDSDTNDQSFLLSPAPGSSSRRRPQTAAPSSDASKGGPGRVVEPPSEAPLFLSALRTVLLEVGVVLHSIVIGFTLGLSSGPAHRALLTALLLHQALEGLALGSRLASFSDAAAATLALVYAVTTPLGILLAAAWGDSWVSRKPDTLHT